MKLFLKQSAVLIGVSLILGLLVNAVRPEGIPLLAQELPTLELASTDGTENEPAIAIISLEQAKKFYDGGILFIDARHDEYYRDGHIRNAFRSDDFMGLLYVLDSMSVMKHDPIVTYCDGDECGSSEELAYDLQASGFQKIYVFKGGWSDWVSAGFPTDQ